MEALASAFACAFSGLTLAALPLRSLMALVVFRAMFAYTERHERGQRPGFRAPMFSAVMTPHRSLDRKGFLVLMAWCGRQLRRRHGVPDRRRLAGDRLVRARCALLYWAFG